MDSKPKFDTAQVYRTVAELLPTEGRDFNLKLATDKDGKQSVVLEGLTPLGKAWLPFLKERLENPLKDKGVGVEQAAAGVTAPVATVNTVRAAITAEFDAKLQARLTDQLNLVTRTRDETLRLQKARVTHLGPETAPDEKERNAMNAQRKAEQELKRLQTVRDKVQAIRKTVAERAVRAAEYDKQAGRDRSFDPDAPLKSLFEQSDVDARFRRAESTIEQMAEHAVMMDALGESAVHELKQYSLPRGK